MYGYCGSEKAFRNWLEKALRRAWSKHPVKLGLLQKNRYSKRNPETGRMCYFIDCEHCGQSTKQDTVECNHKETVGGLPSLAMLGEFANRLLLITDDNELELLCHDCHAAVTHSERSGLSIEDAKLDKKAIMFIEKYDAKEQKARLSKVGIEPAKNEKARRKQVFEYLKKQQEGKENGPRTDTTSSKREPIDETPKATIHYVQSRRPNTRQD